MATLTITLSDAGFPSNFSGDLLAFKDAILANITASINSDNLILGKIGGSAPVSDIGPWLNGRIWKAWDGSGYSPTSFVVGNANFATTFSASTLTANRTITVPDKSGTLALTSDAYSGRATVVLTGATPTVDWSASNNFYEILTAGTTFTMSNSLPGQEIAVAVVKNGASNFVATFSGVSWTGGSQPAQTTWTSGTITDIWIFQNIAGTIFGRVLLNYI